MALLAKERSKEKKPLKLGLIDVSRAHFYAKSQRKVYIRLPEGDPRAGDGQTCGLLQRTMYGTLDAAALWEEEYSKTLTAAGFTKGIANPCHFHHPTRHISTLVHGDDFITVADVEGQKYMEEVLGAQYQIKTKMIGGEKGDDHEMRALGRVIAFKPWGIQYEPDPVHAEIVIKELGLQGANPVATPFAKIVHAKGHEKAVIVARRESDEPVCEDQGKIPRLDEQREKRYQSLAARLNYFALDRPDIMYPVKELMRKMADPDEEDESALKRVARYLIGKPRMVTRYLWSELPRRIKTSVDSDFAGCHRTRKSTSGGVIQWGRQLLKAWSKTQAIIALSTGEAELAALVRGATEGLGMQAVLNDYGVHVDLEIESDATAAIGMVKRQGLGRVRHLAVADLWIQQRVRHRDIVVNKQLGADNCSDMLTKGLDQATSLKHCTEMGCGFIPGRSAIAPMRK
eukprot:12416353-Karenia_brevis.AAC.1